MSWRLGWTRGFRRAWPVENCAGGPRAVAGLRERTADAADRAREAVDDARAGETGALARVVALAGGALAAGVLLRRLLRH